MLKRLRCALEERDGNFAVFTALAALPLIMALGGVADFGGMYVAATAAQDASDAAAIAAAKRLETGTVAQAMDDAQLYGRARLARTSANVTLTPVIDQKAGTVTVTANGTFETSFLKLTHMDDLPFVRQSTAAIRQKGFMDFYFLLDVSESMNIAASASDRAKLMATTKAINNRPCAFACHEVEPYWSPLSVYQMNENAGSNKARLRIDVLREAADAMIDKVVAKNSEPNSLLAIRIQTNGFGITFEKGKGPNVDATSLKASIRTFAVGDTHTSFALALLGLAQQLGTQGDGKSADSPRKVALMITDGVKDESFSSAGLGPITPTLCDQIKSKGVDLAILEIKYVADPDYQGYYQDRVASYYSRISPSLQSCASQGLYYQATDSLDAPAKLLALTDKLVTQRLHIAQ